MNGDIEAYKAWAPPGARWVDWAKPVLFACMGGPIKVSERVEKFMDKIMNSRTFDSETRGGGVFDGETRGGGAFDGESRGGGAFDGESYRNTATGIRDSENAYVNNRDAGGFEGIRAEWMRQFDSTTAIIVDLPGASGVYEGMALAKLGYRPVPLYNGVSGPNFTRPFLPPATPLVQVDEIVAALQNGVIRLPWMALRPDAPPAFMLDANRMGRYGAGVNKYQKAAPGDFDNRWRLFPQDMPSAAYMLANGIRSVVVRTDKILEDLAHILYSYERQGIIIYLNNGKSQSRADINKPPFYAFPLRRFGVTLRLRRNSAGGFGEVVPEPSRGGGVHHHHGIG